MKRDLHGNEIEHHHRAKGQEGEQQHPHPGHGGRRFPTRLARNVARGLRKELPGCGEHRKGKQIDPERGTPRQVGEEAAGLPPEKWSILRVRVFGYFAL